MPIYEYCCRRCRHVFEQIVLSAEDQANCPNCNSEMIEKQLSIFSSPGSRPEETASGGGCGCTPQTCGCR